MKIVSVEEMRRIEQAADERGHSYDAMMDMAGRSVADMAATAILSGPAQKVLILVGPGNNGGDGLVAAHYLREMDYEITIYVWNRNIRGDENFRRLRRRRRGLAILWADNDPDGEKLRAEVQAADLIIDALLGTGVTRPIEGDLARILETVKAEVKALRTRELDMGSLGIPRFPLVEAKMLGALPEPGAPPDEFGADEDDEFLEDLRSVLESDGNDEDEDFDEDEMFWDDDFDQDSMPIPWPKPAILAVDCPSGLNCDTGAIDPAALAADLTVTFAFPKWGQLQYPGAGACGLLEVADIGVPPDLAEGIQTEIALPGSVRPLLPLRPVDAHKGTFGKAMIVAGSVSYTGAAHLSAAAAARMGTGLVTLAIPAPLHAVLAGGLPEVTWRPLPHAAEGTHAAEGVPVLLSALESYDALLVGPGFTTEPGARAFVEGLFAPNGLAAETWKGRTVVDADALNILAGLPDWAGRLPPLSILTPHPGEMARLTGTTVAEINSQRISTARRWAEQWGHVVLLKGPYSVIAHPDGRVRVLPFATATLATAGSGDVLAGAIVSMLAQGLSPFDAAVCGAYVHGFAGTLIWRDAGQYMAIAGDLVERLPEALTTLYSGR